MANTTYTIKIQTLRPGFIPGGIGTNSAKLGMVPLPD